MTDPLRREAFRRSPATKSPLGSSVLLSGGGSHERSTSLIDARTLSPVEASRSRERENTLLGMMLVDVEPPKKCRADSDGLSRSRSDKDARLPRMSNHATDPNSQSSPAIFRHDLRPVSSDSTGTMNTCRSNMSMSSMVSVQETIPPFQPVLETTPSVTSKHPSSFESSLSPVPSILEEMFTIFGLAWRSSISALCWFSTFLVNTAMVGHIRNTPTFISAVVMSGMFTSIMGLSVAYGVCGGMATLGGQAFAAQNYPRIGNILQRTICIQLLLAVPVCVVWSWSKQLLSLTGQSAEITDLAGHYITILAIGYLPGVMCEVLTNYLVCQDVVLPVLPVQFVANVVNLVVGYVLVFHTNLGFLGAAWSAVFAHTVALVCYLLVLRFSELKAWQGWSPKAFSQWGPLLRLSGSSTFLLCAEWWLFEIVGFTAGYVGPDGVVSLAVWGVAWQIMMCVLMVSLGLQVAMTNRISSELGSGEYEVAKRSAVIGLCTGFVWAFGVSVVIFSFQNVITKIWTEDEVLAGHVTELMPFMCLFATGHSFQLVLGGTLVGIGKQHTGRVAKLVGYYAVGLPVALLLAFPGGMGVKGLVMGLCCATFSLCGFFVAVIWRTDWQLQSELARRESDVPFALPPSGSFEELSEQSYLLGRS